LPDALPISSWSTPAPPRARHLWSRPARSLGAMATSSTPPRLLFQPGVPDFLDLPWEVGVSEWDHHRLVDMPAGIHRHPVVFVAYEEGVFAIKEMPKHLAENEFAVLD